MAKKQLVLVDEVQREEPKSLWGRPWTRGADVQSVWRRYGWMPPTEYRNDWLFKQNREALKDDR